MENKTVVITRPRAEKDALTGLLHRRGYHVVHEPLTHVILRTDAQEKLEQTLLTHPDAIIVTSPQGLRALASFTELRDMAVICVGPGTGNAALANGFTRVYTAGGNVERLIEYVLAAYDPDSRFLYVSAEHVRVDLAALLLRQGMGVERVVAYEAIAAESFSDIFAEHLKRGRIGAITFLSQRTADVFMSLATEAKLITTLRDVYACCLSNSIAKSLGEKKWRRVYVARTATLVSLGDCVDRAFTTRKKA